MRGGKKIVNKQSALRYKALCGALYSAKMKIAPKHHQKLGGRKGSIGKIGRVGGRLVSDGCERLMGGWSGGVRETHPQRALCTQNNFLANLWLFLPKSDQSAAAKAK